MREAKWKSIKSFYSDCWLNERDLYMNRKHNKTHDGNWHMAMDGHTRISMSIDWYAPVVPHCARTYHTIDRTMCLVHRKYGQKMLIAHILGILSAFLAISLSPPFFLSLNLCAIFTLQFLVNTLFLCNHAFFCILWIDNRWLHDGYKFFARKQRYADNDDGDDEMQHDSAWWSSSFRKPSITLTILQKKTVSKSSSHFN